MLLSDIIDEIMLRTGQFVAGDISNLNINYNQFWIIVRKALAFYDKHKPVTRSLLIITDSNAQYIFPSNDTPLFISSAIPTGYGYVNPFTITAYGSDFSPNAPIAVFRYEPPRLYTSLGGQFEVKANFARSYTITYDTDGKTITEIDFPEITDSDVYLFDLIEGIFLETVGKFRRAFNLADNPIVMDFDMLVQEGAAKIQDAKDNIITTNSWRLAIGV